MSELSDYKRLVADPLEAQLRRDLTAARRERDEARNNLTAAHGAWLDEAEFRSRETQRAEAAEAERDALQARLDGVLAACAPFVKAAPAIITRPIDGDEYPDNDVFWKHSFSVREEGTASVSATSAVGWRTISGKLTVGDIRALSAAVKLEG